MNMNMRKIQGLSSLKPQGGQGSVRSGQWAGEYAGLPVRDEQDLFERMDSLLGMLLSARADLAPGVAGEAAPPPPAGRQFVHLTAAIRVLQDVMAYLPHRLALATLFEENEPALAQAIHAACAMSGKQQGRDAAQLRT